MLINELSDSKIVIRHFKGGPLQLFVFYDKLHKDLQKAQHSFVIKDEIILKLDKNTFYDAKTILIVFKNSSNFTMFTFRIDSIDSKRNKKEIRT